MPACDISPLARPLQHRKFPSGAVGACSLTVQARGPAACALILTSSVAHSAAPQAPFPIAPVYVSVGGSQSIRVRIWAGSVMPCDSGLARLLDAKVKPGFEATLWTDSQSICIEQTHEGFPDVGWSAPKIVFRNALCLHWGGKGKFARCAQWAAVPIHLTLSSSKV